MSARKFWTYLLIVSAATLGLLYGIDTGYPESQAISEFTMLTIGVFAAIVVFAYLQGVKTAVGPSKYQFVRFTLVLIFVKMCISIMLIVWYVETYSPETKVFVLPFLMIYLIFTVYEVYVMEKVARMKPPADER